MRVRVQFEPFRAVPSIGFWAALGRKKLDDIRLSNNRADVYGYWEVGCITMGTPQVPCFYLDERSLMIEKCPTEPKRVWEKGIILFYETESDFKGINLLTVLDNVHGPEITFVILCQADLKRNHFSYYIAFPAKVPNCPVYCTEVAEMTDDEASRETVVLTDCCARPLTTNMVVFGWPTRRHLAATSQSVLLVRHGTGKLYRVRLEYESSPVEALFVPGWEADANGRVLPRAIDLTPLTDPKQLAKSAADLNLKLIKWQLAPSLDLDRIQTTKCVLFGAGTLGCNVGWGIKDITLIDSGSCSYSNPVRQSLITFEDAQRGRSKAEAVARNALLIDPGCTVKPEVLNIPMPGHRYDDLQELLSKCEAVDDLVSESDAVFLLTDSRESRWLPTLLSTIRGKLCITIAVGFDHFVAMRHGPSCYFCQDGIAPIDSVTNRTLDQQCTVSRPGLSMIASGYGVELLVNSLDQTRSLPSPADSVQQIRGSLNDLHTLVGPASEYCTACSHRVQALAQSDLKGFLGNVFSGPRYLEVVTKLDQLDLLKDDVLEIFE